MTNELIQYCGCKKAADAMNEVRKLTRRDTLLEVAKMAREKLVLKNAMKMLEFTLELERMAEGK